MRRVRCDHGGQPVQPMPRSTVVLGTVTMLLELALCEACHAIATDGGQVIVGPEHGDDATPRMAIHAADLREIRRAQSGRRPSKPAPRPEPQNVRTTRTVGGFKVTLFADPRLTDRATVEWSQRYAAGDVPAATYRRILAALAAGPDGPTGRPVISAADPRPGRDAREKPMDAPSKRQTKVRLKWDPRVGFYDANEAKPRTPDAVARAEAKRQARIDAMVGTPRRTTGTPRRSAGTPSRRIAPLIPPCTCQPDSIPGLPGVAPEPPVPVPHHEARARAAAAVADAKAYQVAIQKAVDGKDLSASDLAALTVDHDAIRSDLASRIADRD